MAKPRTRDEIAAAFGEQPKRSRADIENAFNVPRQGAPRLTVTLPGGRGLATDLPDTPAPIGELGARVLADNRQRAPRVPLGELRAPSMTVRLNDGTVIMAPQGDEARKDYANSLIQQHRQRTERRAQELRAVAESIDSPRRIADPAFQFMSGLYGGIRTLLSEGGELGDALLGMKGATTAGGMWGKLANTLAGGSVLGQIAGIGADERLRRGNLENAERGGGTRVLRAVGDTLAAPFGLLADTMEGATTAAGKFEREQNRWGVRTDENGNPVGSALNPLNWTFGDSPTILGQANQFANALGSTAPSLSGYALSSPLRAATVGSAMGATSNAEQARQEIDAAWADGTLQESDVFRRLVAQGHKPEDVYRAMRESAGQGAAIGSAIPAGVGGLVTKRIFGPIDAAALRTGASRATTAAGRVALGVAGDPAEEGIEQIAANIGADRASGMQGDAGRGVAENVIGALPFGVLGGGRAVGRAIRGQVAEAVDILRDPNATAGDKYDALQWIEQHGTNAEKAAVAAQSGVIIAPDAAPTTPTAPTVPARELGAPGAWAGAVPVPARPTGAFTTAVQAARDHAAATVQVTQEQAQEAAQAAQDAVATQSEPEAVGAAIRAAQETQQTAQQAAQIAGLADADILDHLAGLLDEEPNGQTDAVEGGEIAGANPAESGAVAPVVPAGEGEAQVSTAINAKPDEQAESRASAASQAASLQAVPQDAAVAAANSVANPANLLPDLRGGEEVVMQNRDRKRAASVLQMQDIRRNPDPDRLGFSRDPNTGAPMISEGAQVPESDKGRADIVKEPDGTVTPVRYAVVEADSLDASHDADGNVNPNYANAPMKALNNGRTAGLQAAHDTGNAQDYVRGIIADSGLHGVSQEAIASKRKPILVRLFDPALNVGDMGARSNAQQQLGLSPVEQAQTDARALPDLSGLEWNEDGSISPMRNANFFRAWFANLGATQAANLQNKNGQANAMALQRVRAALVQRAYGDERLLSALTEDVDPDNRNVVNALARAAPGFAKLDDTPLARDVKTALVEGFQTLRDAKERGLSVDDALAQVDMFGRDPDADMAARYMALNARSAKRMAEAFAAVAEYAARAEQQAATLDVFGDAPQHAASDALHSAGITEKEHGATNRDDAGVVGEGNGSRQQVESERAATSDAGAFQLESQQSAEAKAESQVSQSGLFAPPTAQEHNRAAREAKDAERNGLGRDVVRPEQGEGDLLAGDRPEQSRIDDNAPKPSRTPKPDAAEITPYYSRTERGTGDERNLIIQHNLTAENLLHADRIGGLAVPSLAVTKVDSPLSGFGEITLLGTSHLADPKGYAKTQVFGADIYSPRYPGITYRLDKNGLKAINRALAPHRNEGESDLYSGGDRSGVDFLAQRKDFNRWADANGVDQDVHARETAAAELLRDSGAKEMLFQGFDYNGNRRYKAHTLENVVRELKKELRGGENYNYGVGSLRAHFTPRFRSIDAIRKAKGALASKEQMEAAKQEIDSEFFGIVDMLRKENPSHTNQFMFTDSVLAVMADAAKKGLHRAAKEYGINVGQDSARAAVEFMEKLRTLPTEYFEAKVLREVDLAEFAAAVVPKGVDPRVVEKLEKRGVRVAFYKRGDDADRAQVIRQQAESTQDALFSRQESNAAPAFLTRAADVQAAITKAYGGLLARAERAGLVEVHQTEAEALQSAAKARAAKSGEPVGEALKRLRDAILRQVAYHGTPHTVDKFSLQKIGTGEGAQAYGWGIYFASLRKVAEWYAENARTDAIFGALILSTPVEQRIRGWMQEADRNGDSMAAGVYDELLAGDLAPAVLRRQYANSLRDGEIEQSEHDQAVAAIERAEQLLKGRGNLYRVEVPEDSDLLDYDKPLSEQPEKVKAALRGLPGALLFYVADRYAMQEGATWGDLAALAIDAADPEHTGGWLYQAFVQDAIAENPARAASEALLAAGIPGLRYLDGNSRNAGGGSHNYVIWDEAAIGDPEVEPLLSQNGSMEGFFDPQTGKAFLIADALTPATAPGTFMHEVGIHASPEIAGVFDAAAALVANPGVNKWAQQAAQRMASAGETSPEEAAAYLVTAYENDRANAPGSVRRWVRDFIAAVKAWLRRHNLPSGSIGVPEIAAIARANARATQRRAAGSLMASQQDDGFSARNNNIMFSRAPANVLANVRAQMAETEQRIGGREAYEASGSTLPYQVWVGSQTPAYQAFAKQAAPEAMKQEPGAAKPEKPKAAKPQEPEAPEPPENVAIDDVTGIAHEYSQKYMREIGEDEITKGLPQAWKQQLAAALTEYMGKGDPEQRYAYGQEVVESILDGQPPSSHTEALLSVYLRDLKNRQIDLESRPESDILAQAELAQNQQRQMAIHIAMFKGGSALGRALNIRRMLLKKDFSYEALVRRELSRNGGKALDKATQDKLREMADTIAKQTKRLEEMEAALADKAAAAAFAHARRRSASRARADREWEDRAAAARRRIASAEGVKTRNKQAGAVMSPALLYDYATLGAYHVRKGAVALADMIAAIRTDIGSVIDEWLDDMPRIHALAKKLAQGNKETPSDVAADIKDREPTAADVLRMMRALAAAGVVSHVEAIEQASKLLKMDNATVRQMLIDGTPSAHTRSETAQIVSDIRKAARLESEIERLEAQRPKQVKPRTVRKDSPEVAAKREELRVLKQSLRERGEDVDFNAQQERHYERRAAYWQNRIDTGDYNDTPKVPRAIANAVAQARLRSIEAQNAFIEWQYEQSLKDMTRTQRAMHRAFNLLQMPRAIQSSSDLSALGRQGLLLGLGHPVVFAKAAWDTIGAAFSQAKYEAIHHDIRENPAYANAVIDGVEFTDLNAGSLTRREEIFASRLLAKIPVYFGGGVLRGSQRQYTAFLNVLRLNAYTSMMANQDRGAGKALAGVVNAFSGRGNISNQKLANMMVGASTVFYAPRFAVSRLQTVVGQPIWRSEARGYRTVVAKEYGRMFLGMSAYMALLALAVAGMRDDDDDSPLITFDWRSSDFSKFRMGGIRLDPLAGLAQWVTLIGRQVTGETEADGKVSPLTTGSTLRDLEIWLGMDVPPHKMGKDGKLAFGSRNGANIIQDFLRSKLAPIPGAYLNWRAGETPGGDKTDLQTELLGLVHPLSYGDIVDGSRADTSNMQRAGIAAASIFGIGVQARSSQDDAQLARFNQRVQQARDDVRTRLMALPMDQWESALEAMRPEYGPLLDGTTLQIYQRDGKYGYAGEPARDDQGRPKLKNTRLATDYRDAANAAPGEEVNHIIPDNLVRHHPLMARAREFGFDLDAPENLLAMPRDPEPGRVAHHGDHKHYDAQVYKELQRAQRRLKNRFDSLDAAPPQDVLREVRRVQDDMRKRLESGDVPTKDGRLVMRDNQTNTRVA